MLTIASDIFSVFAGIIPVVVVVVVVVCCCCRLLLCMIDRRESLQERERESQHSSVVRMWE